MGNHSEVWAPWSSFVLSEPSPPARTTVGAFHATQPGDIRSDELVAEWQEQAHEIAGCLSYALHMNGARDRNRTGMASRPADFKSDASTNFATRANGWHCPTAWIVDRNENARKRGRPAIRLSQSILRRWRPGSELNRRTRLCRPLHNHSATRPVGLCSLTEATASYRSNETPSTGVSCTRNGTGFAPCPASRQPRPWLTGIDEAGNYVPSPRTWQHPRWAIPQRGRHPVHRRDIQPAHFLPSCGKAPLAFAHSI